MEKSTKKSSQDLDLSPIVKSIGGRKKQIKDGGDKRESQESKAGWKSATFTTSTPIARSSSRKRQSGGSKDAEGRNQKKKKKKKDDDTGSESMIEDSQLARPLPSLEASSDSLSTTLASLEGSSDSMSSINTSQTRSSRSGRAIKPSRKILENSSATEDKTVGKSTKLETKKKRGESVPCLASTTEKIADQSKKEGTKKKTAKPLAKESPAPKKSTGKSGKTTAKKSAEVSPVPAESQVMKPEGAAGPEEETLSTNSSQQISVLPISDTSLSCSNSSHPVMDNIVKTEVQVGNETFIMTTVLKTESDIDIAHGTSTESSGINSNSKTPVSQESQAVAAAATSLLSPVKEEKTDIVKVVSELSAAAVGVACEKQSDTNLTDIPLLSGEITSHSVQASDEIYQNQRSGLDSSNASNVVSVSSQMPTRGKSPKGIIVSSGNTTVATRNSHPTATKTVTSNLQIRNSMDSTAGPTKETVANAPQREFPGSSSKAITVNSPTPPVSKATAHSVVNNPLVAFSPSSIPKKPAAIIKIIRCKTSDPSIGSKLKASLSGDASQSSSQAVTSVKAPSAPGQTVTPIKSTAFLDEAVTHVQLTPAVSSDSLGKARTLDKVIPPSKSSTPLDNVGASVKSLTSLDKVVTPAKPSVISVKCLPPVNKTVLDKSSASLTSKSSVEIASSGKSSTSVVADLRNSKDDDEDDEIPNNRRRDAEVVKGDEDAREESSTQKSLDPDEVFREQMHSSLSIVKESHATDSSIIGKSRKKLKVLYPRRAAPSPQASSDAASQKTPSSATFSGEKSNNANLIPNSVTSKNMKGSNQMPASSKGNAHRLDIDSNSNIETGGTESADLSLSLLEKSDVNVMDVSCSVMNDNESGNSRSGMCPSPTVFSPKDKENLTDMNLNSSLNIKSSKKVLEPQKLEVDKANMRTTRGNPSRKMIGTSARTRITKPDKLCRHERIDSSEKGKKKKKRWILNTEFESLYRKVVADDSENASAERKTNTFINELVQKANQLLEAGQVVEEPGDVDLADGTDEEQEGMHEEEDSSNRCVQRNIQGDGGDGDDDDGKGNVDDANRSEGSKEVGGERSDVDKRTSQTPRSKKEKMKNVDMSLESNLGVSDVQQENRNKKEKMKRVDTPTESGLGASDLQEENSSTNSRKKPREKLSNTPSSSPEKKTIAAERLRGKNAKFRKDTETSEKMDEAISMPTSVLVTSAASLTTSTTVTLATSLSSTSTSPSFVSASSLSSSTKMMLTTSVDVHKSKSLSPKTSKHISSFQKSRSESLDRSQNSSVATSNPAAHPETVTKESLPGKEVRSSEPSCDAPGTAPDSAARKKLSVSSPEKSVAIPEILNPESAASVPVISSNTHTKASTITQKTLKNLRTMSTNDSDRQVRELSTAQTGFPSEAPARVTYQSRGTSPIKAFMTSECECCMRRQDTRSQATMTESFNFLDKPQSSSDIRDEHSAATVIKEIDFSQITMATDSETGMEFTPCQKGAPNQTKFHQKTLFDFDLKHERRTVNKKVKFSGEMSPIVAPTSMASASVTRSSIITSVTSSLASVTTSAASSCTIPASRSPGPCHSFSSSTSETEASHTSQNTSTLTSSQVVHGSDNEADSAEQLTAFIDSDDEYNTNCNANTENSPKNGHPETDQKLEMNQPFVALERLSPSKLLTSARIVPSASPGKSPPAKIALKSAKSASSAAPNVLAAAERLKDSSPKGSSNLRDFQNSLKKTADAQKQKESSKINVAAPTTTLSSNVSTKNTSSSSENTQINKSASLGTVPLKTGTSGVSASLPQKVVAVVRICNSQKDATLKHSPGPIKIVPLSKASILSTSSLLSVSKTSKGAASTSSIAFSKPSSTTIKIVPLPKTSVLLSQSSQASPVKNLTATPPASSPSPSKTSPEKDSFVDLQSQISILHDSTSDQTKKMTCSQEHPVASSEVEQSAKTACSPEQCTPYGRGKRVRKQVDLDMGTPTKRRKVSGKCAKNDDGKEEIPDEADGAQVKRKVKKKPGRKRLDESYDDVGETTGRKCVICNRGFKNLKSLKHHMMADHVKVWHPHHPEGTCERADLRKILRVLGSLSCEMCGKKVKFLPYYDFHLKWCGREEEMMKCELCGREVKSMWMSQHEREHRMKKAKLEISRRAVSKKITSSSTIVSGKRNAAIKARSVVQHMVTELKTGTGNKGTERKTHDGEEEEENEDEDGEFKAGSESESDSPCSSGDEEVSFKNTKRASPYVSFPFHRKFTGDTSLPRDPDKFQEVVSWYQNHSLSSDLFLRLLPYKNHWQRTDSNKREKIRKREDRSHEFIIEQLRLNGPSVDSQPQSLHYSQSFKTKDQVTSYCGGRIDSIEWCPTPTFKSTNQYAAVVCQMTNDSEAKIIQQKDGESYIQIWAFGRLSPFINMVEPTLKMSILHSSGHVTSCSWCPRGTWQEQDTPLVPDVYHRLGLLAVASLDGHVRIYSVPHPDDLTVTPEVTTPDLYQATPVVVLRNVENSDGAGCLVVAWQPSDECKLILAGYADGIIRMWNLASTSVLLVRSLVSGTKELYPIRSFLAHSRPIRCLTWNKRLSVFVSGSDDKKMKFWRLDNLDKDHDTALLQTPVTTVKWPLLETGVVYGKDHIFLLDRCPTGYQDGGFRETLIRYQPTNHLNLVWEVDYIDWHNILLACDSSGSVKGARLRDMSCDQINIHAIAHREFPIFSTKIKPRSLSTNLEKKEASQSSVRKMDETKDSGSTMADESYANQSTADTNQSTVSIAGHVTDDNQSIISKTAQVTDVNQSTVSKVDHVKSRLRKVKKEKKIHEKVYGYKDFHESMEKCCLVFVDDLNTNILAGRKKKTAGPGIDCKRLACYPIESLYSVAANQNVFGSTWVLSGGESGLLRLHNLPGILTNSSKSWFEDSKQGKDDIS